MSGAVSGRALVLGAIVASVVLIAAYLAAGGAGYEPVAVADPCAARDWREPDGVEEAAQQFGLSALDGAACELRVSRETLAVALATPDSRAEFASEYGIEEFELESAIRAGLERAIDDAEAAGALSPLLADGLRAVAERVPVDEAVALIEDGRELFDGSAGLIDGLLP